MQTLNGQIPDIQAAITGIMKTCKQANEHSSALQDAETDLPSKLPEDATRFFSEGMQQMDALDYPPHVRKVMEKYHHEWPVNRSLH